MNATPSPILDALYAGRREDAARLAEEAPELTIFEAAALGRDDEVSALLERDPALANSWAADGHCPLGLAAFFAGSSTVGLLLDRGANVGVASRNAMEVQPLHAAVASRNLESVNLLLARGADPNARQESGYTPLMGAANAGRGDIAQALLASGARADLVSNDGKTAADVARERGHAELAKELTPHGV